MSRAGKLKYLPSGIAVLEFTLAAPQRQFDKESMGYFELVVCGPMAETIDGRLKIGSGVSVQGTLWTRTYRNRRGIRVGETKIFVETMEGECLV